MLLRSAVVVLVALTGCATLPITGVQASGEPLDVQSGLVTHTWTSNDKVAEIQHKDENGNSIGKSDVYEERQHSAQVLEWYPQQGGIRLDDEDFFRIAGDTDAASRIRASRESGVTLNKVGWGVVAAGLAIVAGGMAMRTSPDLADGGLYLSSGGLLTASIGSMLVWWGIGKTRDPHPINDLPYAERASRSYNQRLLAAAAPPPAPVYVPEDAPVISRPAAVKPAKKRARRASVAASAQP